VILVLLIIFMVAAPLATVDVAVDLPVSTAERQPREPKPIFLTLTSDHTLARSDSTVPEHELGRALDAASGNDRERRIFLRADKQVDYGALMEPDEPAARGRLSEVALVGLEARKNPQEHR
jgi:biopolymer transport protein ExbD